LDEVTRTILRSWLLRGPDEAHPRDPAERLTDQEALRQREIVAHAEAMALQGVLTTSQASKLRSKLSQRQTSPTETTSNQPAKRKLPSRKQSARGTLTQEEITQLKTAIESEARVLRFTQDHSSNYFASLTGKPSAQALGLSTEQSQMLNRLDQLTREIIQDWLLRGLDAAAPPPDLADRLSTQGTRRRDQIIYHAERVARLGILTPTQLGLANQRYWRSLGYMALQDPEVSARLQPSPEQREAIADRIANKTRVQVTSDSTLGLLRSKVTGADAQIGRAADLEIRRRIGDAETLIWEVLDPIQLDTLQKLLDSKIGAPRHR
jgi:hypothetical protein